MGWISLRTTVWCSASHLWGFVDGKTAREDIDGAHLWVKLGFEIIDFKYIYSFKFMNVCYKMCEV